MPNSISLFLGLSSPQNDPTSDTFLELQEVQSDGITYDNVLFKATVPAAKKYKFVKNISVQFSDTNGFISFKWFNITDGVSFGNASEIFASDPETTQNALFLVNVKSETFLEIATGPPANLEIGIKIIATSGVRAILISNTFAYIEEINDFSNVVADQSFSDHILDTANPHSLSKGSLGLANVLNIKDKIDTINPTVNDDFNAGFGQHSRWLNTVTGQELVCFDSTVGAANWVNITVGGGGGTDNDAIHNNINGELGSITEKVSPIGADTLLIEDSATSNAKKRIKILNLPHPLHASNHIDGTDDIQDATSGQKGLATPTQISKLNSIESGAEANQSDAEIKTSYENNADTNGFTDAEQTKLGNQSGTNTGDEPDATTTSKGVVELATDGENAASVVVQGDDARLSDSRNPSGVAAGDLNGNYPNPTVNDGADSTAIHSNVNGEIAALPSKATPLSTDIILIEDSNASNAKKKITVGDFLVSDHSGNHVNGQDDIQNATASQKGLATATQITKLDGIETAATADQSDAEIKTAYENNADTNVFDNAKQTKLSGIETSAKDDQNAAEVPFTPAGDIAATNTQAAVVEVRDDTDTKLSGKADVFSNRATLDLVTVPTIEAATAPSSPANGWIWIRTSDSNVFKYDSTRSKWLGVDAIMRPIQRDGDNNAGNYLRQSGDINTNESPLYFGENVTLVGIVGTTKETENWVLRLEDHDGVFSNLDITIDDGGGGVADKFSKFDLDTDYVAANLIQALIFSSASGKVNRPQFYLDFRRRG